jgi:RecB family endonuclease NucS
MKRHSITAICQKAQELSQTADRYTKLIKINEVNTPENISKMDKFWRYNDLIVKAQVNEIIRLNAEPETELPEWFTDMKKESDNLLGNIKIICEDHNNQIQKSI